MYKVDSVNQGVRVKSQLKRQTNQGRVTPCTKCAKRHDGTICYRETSTCFSCGQQGHLIWDYPFRMNA